MIRSWWRNFLDSFTYLSNKDVKWLERNNWFCKNIQTFPKSCLKLIVYCTMPACGVGMIIITFCVLMVYLHYAKTTVRVAEFGGVGFLGIVSGIGLLRKQVQLLKISLIALSISSINATIAPPTNANAINTTPTVANGNGFTAGKTALTIAPVTCSSTYSITMPDMRKPRNTTKAMKICIAKSSVRILNGMMLYVKHCTRIKYQGGTTWRYGKREDWQ